MPDVRVGIVSWNTAELLDRCLRALPAALGDLDAEIVVVDNASDDGSAEVAARPGVTVIRNASNRGYARAMNQALATTTAPVLVALNPDTEPPPGSLARLVERLHRHPDAGLVVPRLVHDDGRLQHSVHRFPSVTVTAMVSLVPRRLQQGAIGRRWWLHGAAPHDASGEIDWAIGAVHVIRASAVAPDPPYSERWFMYVEDLELCWRLHQRSWKVRLEADVSIPHVGNASGAQAWGTSRSRRYWVASYDFYALTHGRPAARRWAAMNTVGAAVQLTLQLVGFLASGRRHAGRGRAARELARVLPVHARALWDPQGPQPAASVPGR